MRNYRGEKHESINLKSPSLMWGLDHGVLDVQVFSIQWEQSRISSNGVWDQRIFSRRGFTVFICLNKRLSKDQ